MIIYKNKSQEINKMCVKLTTALKATSSGSY